jgi:mercuric ion binding protein
MKTLKLFSLAALSMAITTVAVAQSKSETFKVSGNCGMCKTKIEKAAKEAGAKDATWNADTKDLTVSYKSSTTNTAKIQQKIAEVGYDNAGFKATSEAYDKLHGCCKYERASSVKKESCCSDEASCSHGDHAGMGKHDGMSKADCCKDGKCTKEGHDGKDCCTKMDAKKMDCCKDGKCTKEGHDGKDCCKKS